MLRRRLARTPATGIAGTEAGREKPVVVVAAMLFILTLFLGATGISFQMTNVLFPASEL